MIKYSTAIIEGHSWPSAGSPLESLYGYRKYDIHNQTRNFENSFDLINPWQSSEKSYNCIIVADELCKTALPFYIRRCLRVALLKESPNLVLTIPVQLLQSRYDLVFTHLRSHVELGPPFHFLPYSSNFLGLKANSCRPISIPLLAHKNLLCSFIGNLTHNQSSYGYSFRKEVYELISSKNEISKFGRDINPIETKQEGLLPFGFSIVMENAREDYYFTEKIIDCFLTGTIPVYWGCPSIGKFFDSRGILTFNSAEELSKLIESLSFSLYAKLRPFVEINFHKAISGNLADFSGYLFRLSESLAIKDFLKSNRRSCIQYDLASKLKARLRCNLYDI